MRINEVEQLAGITKKNIRFYEEQGLLRPDRNKENGYREYCEEDIQTLKQIKLLRKLGLPLEEIRMMQTGRSTVADSMSRHLVTLERERKNLEQSEVLCRRLKEEEGTLRNLDANVLLEEMERMEQKGASFQNRQRYDIRLSYVAPVLICLMMVLLMVFFIAAMVWTVKTDPQEAPPLAFTIVMLGAPLAVIGGVIYAMFQRVNEIRKGEMDDARKY